MKKASAILCLLLAGCASGVHMTDDEAKACRDEGCSVWTMNELRALAAKVGKQAYEKGWADSNKQAARGM